MQTCVGCGKGAPETDTNYTLISAQFGWRLTRTKQNDGTIMLEWRCPTCWRDFKRARTAADAVSMMGDKAHEMRPPAAPDTEPPIEFPPRNKTSRAPVRGPTPMPPPAAPRRGRLPS